MTANHFTFTLARLKALEPRDKTYAVKDDKNPALSARVSPGGIVTLQVRRRPKGSHKVVTVSICKLTDGLAMVEIHSRVTEVITSFNAGINPNTKAKQDAVTEEVQSRTLQSVFDEYKGKLHKYTHKLLSESTLKAYETVITRDVADWADQPMINITPVMVLNRYKDLTKKGRSAKKMAGLIVSCWTYANEMADTGDGIDAYGPAPIKLLNRQLSGWRKAGVRNRKVSADDLPQWLAAVREEGGIAGAYIEMLLLTGLRRRELSGLKWENIDLRKRTFTIVNTKNAKRLTLPVTDRVMEILKWSKKKYPHAACPLPVSNPRYGWV
jgi:integrase